jgi:uncharacterized membrane protein YgcG
VRSGFDFSSWQAVLSTLLGLSIVTLVMVGVRLLVMQTMQQRRERENRQINERLRTLIAAYKTLGGSFTGNLAVDPAHWRDREAPAASEAILTGRADEWSPANGPMTPDRDSRGGERRRRIRDAVEAALSDVILLGTEEQVRLAVHAATALAEGRTVETADLVVSLRTFIRAVLDLDPMPAELAIPKQGPLRPAVGAGRTAGRGDAGNAGGGARGGGGDRGGGGTGALAGGGATGALTGGTLEAEDTPHHR